MVVNGHVYPSVDKSDWGTTYAQRPLLFRNRNGKGFDLQPAVAKTGLADLLTARGAAFGDLFNDGKIDVVVNQLDRAPALLRNVAAGGHWLGIKLIGGAGSRERDAVGSTVYVTAGGVRRRAERWKLHFIRMTNACTLDWGLPRLWMQLKFTGRAARWNAAV